MSKQLSNPFERPGQWYKAALHTHSCGIDGGLPQEELAKRYGKLGFSVVVSTEHERTADVKGLTTKELLVLNGIELHPLYPGHPIRNHHAFGVHVPHGYPTSRAGQKELGACLAQFVELGGAAVLGHPHGVNVDPALAGDAPLDAYELFNVHQESTGGGDREAEWAKALDDGICVPAIAVDDMHFVEELGQAWTMLRMKSLTPKAVVNAIRTGACYSSTGPEIKDFRVADGSVELTCSAAATITFAGSKGKCDTRKASATGRITTHKIAAPDWAFVRAVVTDRKGRKAWTNPIALK